MMTLTKAQKITHLEITREGPTKFSVIVKDVGHDDMFMRFEEVTPARTLQVLVDTLYTIRAARVMKRDGWKCTICGKTNTLSAHHIQFRSHGRVDTMDNLVTLCQEHHDGAHHKKSVPLEVVKEDKMTETGAAPISAPVEEKRICIQCGGEELNKRKYRTKLCHRCYEWKRNNAPTTSANVLRRDR